MTQPPWITTPATAPPSVIATMQHPQACLTLVSRTIPLNCAVFDSSTCRVPDAVALVPRHNNPNLHVWLFLLPLSRATPHLYWSVPLPQIENSSLTSRTTLRYLPQTAFPSGNLYVGYLILNPYHIIGPHIVRGRGFGSSIKDLREFLRNGSRKQTRQHKTVSARPTFGGRRCEHQ